MTQNQTTTHIIGHSRRDFLKTAAAGAGLVAGGGLHALGQSQDATESPAIGGRKPNILLIVCDQLGLDALSAYQCPDVETPNMDRLVRRGISFMESHSTSPVCSPARSSWFTGRMPEETGVVTNDRPIHPSLPTMGAWLRRAGYDTAYCGKWHLPEGYPVAIDGFDILPIGQGQGDLNDEVVSRTCDAYIKSKARSKTPWLLVSSLLQPHDICYWAIQQQQLVPGDLPFPGISGELPELPPNHYNLPEAPEIVNSRQFKIWDANQWRYYIWIYYRMVEMLDADVGRVLDALEDSGQEEDTIVIFTSDHGEGRGRHKNIQKWHPYDEAMKVPFIMSCPGRIDADQVDTRHLVSGIDIMSTVCDYAGIKPPEGSHGRSLRPLAEGREVEWRECLAAETYRVGRILRTEQYKYVWYPDATVEQLFDMKKDPWETVNLYDRPEMSGVLEDHRKLLAAWQAKIQPIEPTPSAV